jgi:hypothetical protein
MMCDFTFKHYADCLEQALSQRYRFYTHLEYWRERPQYPSILLRHDIDNFVKRSVEFARIEASLGCRATYFVRIHGDYNIFHVNDFLRLETIKKLGHEIGLHSDIVEFAQLTGQLDKLDELLKREIVFLEAALGVKVSGVAAHRDFNQAPNSLPYFGALDLSESGLIYNAYDAIFVRDRKYVSEKVDRGIGWWEKCFCQFFGEHEQLTVLTHPRWWFHSHFYED